MSPEIGGSLLGTRHRLLTVLTDKLMIDGCSSEVCKVA